MIGAAVRVSNSPVGAAAALATVAATRKILENCMFAGIEFRRESWLVVLVLLSELSVMRR